jgi:type III secretion system low calcium response chaperone LcrH/SycD
MSLQTLYADAVQEYEVGHYEKAHDLFSSLSTEMPAQPEIWQGLAACSQVQKYYPEALLSWGMAALLDEHDPLPHFHAAECLLAQGDKIEAQKAIRLAMARPCTEELLDRIVRLKEVIDHV